MIDRAEIRRSTTHLLSRSFVAESKTWVCIWPQKAEPKVGEALPLAIHETDRSAIGLRSWRVRRDALRVKMFALAISDRQSILDQLDSRVLRSEPMAGAF